MVNLGFRRQERTAFVLSGGGNLGALQVGMLASLCEHGIEPDVVLGCSVGAMNGAAFAVAPTREGVGRLERAWLGIHSPTLMPSSRVPNAVQLLRRGASLHSSDGLRETIESILGSTSTFEGLEIPFQCVATDVDTATERWFGEGPLVQAILASTALPAVFPPVEIDGRRFVDGGVVDNVPLSRAVELGCTTIWVLHVGPHGRPDADLRRPIDGALLAYWLARNARFARDLASLPEGTEAIVLPPGRRPELRYDDFGQTGSLIQQGKANTDAFLAERAAEIEARRGERSLRSRLGRLRLAGANGVRIGQRAAAAAEGAIVSGDDTASPGPPTEGAPETGVQETDGVRGTDGVQAAGGVQEPAAGAGERPGEPGPT